MARRSWYGMLMRRTEMPSAFSQRHRVSCPCHFAFQFGSSTTAGPFFLAGRNRACTLLFSGHGDFITLVNVRMLSCLRLLGEAVRWASFGGVAASHSSLCAIVS